MTSFASQIATTLNVADWQVTNAIELIVDGATIPFIARYRKERTGELTDIELLELEKLYYRHLQLEERKKTVLNSLEEQGVITAELKQQVTSSQTLAEIEDIYLPFKPKRKTRAVIAQGRGLEPLAKMIMSENLSNVEEVAQRYVSVKSGVNNIDDALSGARDIIAEWLSERQWVRQKLRTLFEKDSILISKAVKGKETDHDNNRGEKYEAWFDWREIARKAPSHRLLAVFRGEKEGFLKIKIQPELETAIHILTSRLLKNNNDTTNQKELAIVDSTKRLLFPSLETELRSNLKEKTDEASIKVFCDNLQQLLLSPPLGQKRVLAIDPGFRTGCKIVCLDKNGSLLHNDTIYPHPPQRDMKMAMKKINNLVDSHNIEAIAIGNGTAGRETEQLIERMRFSRDIIAVMVNEDGASVYSASSNAREEFPEYDVTVRGAVSIGRRLLDPLAELVKIDPKSIGVGQYQHDVNQKLLKQGLQSTVELCVNKVGVNLNTASRELLTYVSGLGSKLALQIIDYRNQNGNFNNREELKKVTGLGNKAFQQAAGFLRIKDGDNILDSTAVHPEQYPIVKKIAKTQGVEPEQLIGDKQLRSSINISELADENIGLLTIKDILDELEKPGRDPRKKFRTFKFDSNIKSITDLSAGMVLQGTVTNITAFGAFIDLGIKESALLHKSQIANEYVSNPSDYLRINQQVTVKVLDVDNERKRIGLSMKNVQQI
ncbi:MAG: RNA-binding transcriptional accessory protein [Bacteroidetes bacterium]|nr:RNA-binding transcriptional accessory protein [Bacteroidota bacterium]MAE09476.1 RNA-binding transcriptional accessory protein [Bacteroidota bacterium]